MCYILDGPICNICENRSVPSQNPLKSGHICSICARTWPSKLWVAGSSPAGRVHLRCAQSLLFFTQSLLRYATAGKISREASNEDDSLFRLSISSLHYFCRWSLRSPVHGARADVRRVTHRRSRRGGARGKVPGQAGPRDRKQKNPQHPRHPHRQGRQARFRAVLRRAPICLRPGGVQGRVGRFHGVHHTQHDVRHQGGHRRPGRNHDRSGADRG